MDRKSSDRTHPCHRGNPPPASKQQPSLKAEIRHFTVTLEKLVSDYPYDITPSSSVGAKGQQLRGVYNIPYYEISGIGPPPSDLTGSNPGDIYLDMSPGRYAAYGQVADSSWKRWYDPQPCHKTESTVVKHPHLQNRFLWCCPSGVSWFVSTTVATSQERAKDRNMVSQDWKKDDETRWREASALIGAAQLGPKVVPKRSPSLSPSLGSPSSFLGKRKERSYRSMLQNSIRRLEEEKCHLQEEIEELEKKCQDAMAGEPDDFAQWVESIIADGIVASRAGLSVLR
ncbi:hypothetical protein C8R43DRAFT_987282 [Mycena crocata]|nr:hypothetical protein C8R43DRAFT_987282 [Mycena crocata]